MKKRRSCLGRAFSWTVWTVLLLGVIYVILRYTQPQVLPEPLRPADTSDTVIEPKPDGIFPQSLLSDLPTDGLPDFTETPVTARIYDTASYDLYPGLFSPDTAFLTDDRWVVVLDPGHQSAGETHDIWMSPYSDPSIAASWVRGSYTKIGTRGKATGICEYEITAKMADLVKKELEDRGVTVFLTKSSPDTILTGPARAEVSNRLQADLVLSLHCDGTEGSPDARGSLVQIPECTSLHPDLRTCRLSRYAGQMVLDDYCAVTGFAKRDVTAISSSSAFNWSLSPYVMLEMGFLTNRQDEEKLTDGDFQRTMARGIADGICDYLRHAYAAQHLPTVATTETENP